MSSFSIPASHRYDESPIDSGSTFSIRAKAVALLCLTPLLFIAGCAGRRTTEDSPRVIGNSCTTNGNAQGCVSIYTDGGAVTATARMHSTRWHEQLVTVKPLVMVPISDPSSMTIDTVTMKDDAGNELAKFQSDGSASRTVNLDAQTPYAPCPAAGSTVVAELHGQVWNGASWQPVDTSVAAVSDGSCGAGVAKSTTNMMSDPSVGRGAGLERSFELT